MPNKIVLKVGNKKGGGVFHALCADVGYRLIYLTFNEQDIAELLDISVRALNERFPLRSGMPFMIYDLNDEQVD